MTSTESSLSKEITNTTDSARYVSVSVKQLSSPLAGGVEIKPVNSGELLSTPANLILPGQAKDVFRFFYKGPVDDVERYYRLQWIDEPVTEQKLAQFWSLRREKSVLNITVMVMLLAILAMFHFE